MMIFLESSKIPSHSRICANDARMHAYDLLGLYHKEKRSTLVRDLVVDTNA